MSDLIPLMSPRALDGLMRQGEAVHLVDVRDPADRQGRVGVVADHGPLDVLLAGDAGGLAEGHFLTAFVGQVARAGRAVRLGRRLGHVLQVDDERVDQIEHFPRLAHPSHRPLDKCLASEAGIHGHDQNLIEVIEIIGDPLYFRFGIQG